MIVGFNKIFWGMILIVFHFTLNINEFSITFIPPFIAYIIILSGIKEALIKHPNSYLEKAKIITIIQIVFYLIIFLSGFGQVFQENIIFNGLADVLELMSIAFILTGKAEIKLSQGKELEYRYYMDRVKYYLIAFISLVILINVVGFIHSIGLVFLIALLGFSIKIWVLYLVKKE